MILRRLFVVNSALYNCRYFSSTAKPLKVQEPLIVNNVEYKRDGWTNLKPRIQSYLNRNIYLQDHHPLSIVRKKIVNHFYKSFISNRGNPLFSVADNLSPIVTLEQNFDSLLIPVDHVSRKKSDSFYLNCDHMLRAHCTAHQLDLLKSGLDNFLVIGDVYRRDQIDSSHFPVFHQVDAVRTIRRDKLFENHEGLEIFEPNYVPGSDSELLSANDLRGKVAEAGKQPCHTLEAVKLAEHELKTVLVGLVKHLFGENIKYRWVDAYFPFTQPSFELEIWYNNDWLEVLGAGIMRNEILEKGGITNSIGWAFGIGLERLAMVLYNIPDIRLFWSTDSGFLCQFHETKTTAEMQYKTVSKYNQCYMDVSFWLPDTYTLDNFPVNSFYALVRDIGGDLVEQVKIIDKFFHPKEKKNSLCFRVIYRHMERDLTRDEVNVVHWQIRDEVEKEFNVTHRVI
ncbi:probable phenylalanine--tRNA ligase, mitochondrial [Contarinia nasturtii]|uniref:probable phenylalanine--tRNA ligase, mitochondrial n=1 Tax=Contarinia nasturtii TaxID=265458 RepID=UPI0012D4A4EC|nr:probable phenylalanine--tRNA ligase, mitochondrial [Contarinia nasturtii]